jgi:hypothetical protein
MTITDLKTLMKEINEPNEFTLVPYFTDINFWIYRGENMRLKTLKFNLESKRTSRFDIFINGLFINENDYFIEHRDNDIYIKFRKEKFPPFDRFGNVFELESSDEVKIYGDLERVNG